MSILDKSNVAMATVDEESFHKLNSILQAD